VDSIKEVEEHAKKAKIIYDGFLQRLNKSKQLMFRAAFHLRPTASGVTIVSTLPYAPMRGSKDFTSENLEGILSTLCEALLESDKDLMLSVMRKRGFPERKKQGFREEDAQAAFIRNVIINSFGDFVFVASEFALLGFQWSPLLYPL